MLTPFLNGILASVLVFILLLDLFLVILFYFNGWGVHLRNVAGLLSVYLLGGDQESDTPE